MKTPIDPNSSFRNLFFRPWQSFVISLAFLVNTFTPLPVAQADDFHLPAPGVMVHLSPPLEPPILKGIKVHPNNPFRFDFILDQGDSSPLVGEKSHSLPLAGRVREGDLKQEATRLIKYFLASLTIPEKDLWVNLSPYERDRIIPQSFGLTEMGRDLLAEDYMLKQITASLIYPEDETGKKFWKRVYEQAAKKYGTTNIPVNTFNKVWIVPEKAVVYENAKAGTAYVVESKLKVMLEQDYLALSHSERSEESPPTVIPGNSSVIPPKAPPLDGAPPKAVAGIQNKNDINALGSQIVREIVIPELTKEVNEDKNFAKLRQVYNSLILATWYKKKIKESILAQVYEDKYKVKGVGYSSSVIASPEGTKQSFTTNDIESIYQRYLQAFKKGVYNYIKEDVDPVTQETIPRKYFSGGVQLQFGNGIDSAMTIQSDPSTLLRLEGKNLFVIGSDLWVSRRDPSGRIMLQKLDSRMLGETLFEIRYNNALGSLVGISWKGLPEATKEVIRLVGINDGLVEMVKAAGPNAGDLLRFGLPAVRRIFDTPEEFKEYWNGLVEMAKAAGLNAVYLFEYGLPAVRHIFNTPEEFNEVSKVLVEMANAAGPNAKDLIKDGLWTVREIFNTLEEFKVVGHGLVEMTKAAGPNAGDLIKYVLPAYRHIFNTTEEFNDVSRGLGEMLKAAGPTKAGDLIRQLLLPETSQRITSLSDLLSYSKLITKLFEFMDEEQMRSFYALFFRTNNMGVIMSLLRSKDRWDFVVSLLNLSLTKYGKKQVLIKFLEPYVFSHPEGLTVQILNALGRAYQNNESFKYFLYYVMVSSRAPADVKAWARDYISQHRLFILHHMIAAQLKIGEKRVLVIHNIKDGQGDELIRMVTLIQGLLDFNPEIKVTVVTGRPFLYDHSRVKVVSMADLNRKYWNWDGLKETYDVVIDHYDDRQVYSRILEDNFRASNVSRNAFVYIRSNKSGDNFIFEKVEVGRQEYVDGLGLDQMRTANVYETSFRLVAELGLPLRTGEQDRKEESLINGLPYIPAQEKWREMMLRVGNKSNGSKYEHRVVLLNPYGGERESKGFGSYSQHELIKLLEEIVSKGYKVVILPNGAPWGTQQIAYSLINMLPYRVGNNVGAAPEPTYDPRMFKYFVGYSDYVLTVEGGMMHLAFNMGRPFGVMIKPGAGPVKWIPHGRTSMQGIVQDVGGAVEAVRERRIDDQAIKAGDSAQLTLDQAMRAAEAMPEISDKNIPIVGDRTFEGRKTMRLKKGATLSIPNGLNLEGGNLEKSFLMLKTGSGKFIRGPVINWSVQFTPFAELNRKLRILKYIEELDTKRKDKSRPIVIVEVGCGDGTGLIGLSIALDAAKIKNVILYGYDDQYYSNWQKAPEGVHFVLSQSFEDLIILLGGGKINLLYAHSVLSNFLDKDVDRFLKEVYPSLDLNDGEIRLFPGDRIAFDQYATDRFSIIPENGSVFMSPKPAPGGIDLPPDHQNNGQVMAEQTQEELKAIIKSTPLKIDKGGVDMDIYTTKQSDSVLGDYIIKIPKKLSQENVNTEIIENLDRSWAFIKQYMGDIIAPFTILKDVVVNGQEYKRVIVQKKLTVLHFKIMTDLRSFYDGIAQEKGWRKSFNEVMRELMTKMIHRGISYQDAIAPFNLGLDEDTGEIYFIDFGNAQRKALTPISIRSIINGYYDKISFNGTSLIDKKVMVSLWGRDKDLEGHPVDHPMPDIQFKNQAMGAKGGIDLTPANMNLQTKVDSRHRLWRGPVQRRGFRGNDSREDGDDKQGIKFHLDPAQLAQLQSAPGFVPVIINVQPLKSLPDFLGLNQEPADKFKPETLVKV